MKNFLIILFTSYKGGNNTFSRLSVFLKLMKLAITKSFNKGVLDACSNIDGYKIYSFGYGNLDILYREVFCMKEYHFNTSEKFPVIVDCGSNIGMSILYFNKLYPSSTIIGFEANPYAFKILEKNIEVNKLKNVEIHNIALYDKEDELDFHINTNLTTGTGSLFERKGHENKFSVKAKKLSSYLGNMEKIDLVKIDVEGAELYILNDLFNTSAINKADQYIIEFHHNLSKENSVFSNFIKKFEEHNYGYNISAKYSKLGEGQDIVAHFYKKTD